MISIRTAALTAAGLGGIAVPLVIGVVRAQSALPPPAYTYGVVSIRACKPGPQAYSFGRGPQGGIKAQAVRVSNLLAYAYGVRHAQIVGGPAWLWSDRFDVTFTPDEPENAPDNVTAADGLFPGASNGRTGELSANRQRMQAVLRDRFGLVLRPATKELPIYALTIGGSRHKLAAPKNLNLPPSIMGNRKQITAANATVAALTDVLSTLLNTYVTNETGLDGSYDFKVEWTADSSVQLPGKISPPGEPAHAEDAGGTSIFTALWEQLGLRLQSKKGPVPVLVIEKIERPTQN